MSYPLKTTAAILATTAATVMAYDSLATDLASAKTVCHKPKKAEAVMVKKRVRKHHRWVVVKKHGKPVMVKERKHGKVVMHCVAPKPKAKAKTTTASKAPAASVTTSTTTTTLGVGGALDQLNDCTGSLGRSVVRIILFNYEPVDRFYQCAVNAVRSGHRLIMSIQYGNDWSIARDQAWFRSAMALYAPLKPLEVSVGNEQFFDAAGSGQHYSDVFKAVGPIVKAYDPSTLLGGGEVDPWWPGMNKLEAALKAGLPGMQVLAGHVYPDRNEGWQPSVLLGLAKSHGVMAWATEGLCGPSSWVNYGCRAQSALSGYTLAIEWYVPTAPAAAAPVASPAVPAPQSASLPTPTSTED